MGKLICRLLLAAFYSFAGYAHIADPDPFLLITPDWVPMPRAVVIWTGVAELAGAVALLQSWSKQLRRAGAIGLALYAVCVFPANINHFAMDMAREDGGAGLAYHVPRMIAQPVIIWLSLWAGEVINWPLRLRR
ncbi:DoxX family protein [Altererythrobacter sp. ZODW24]|uniref:DoxX family protein n=1 Tax=Altererythrobacter sp. ZODW24 TaxID=2185142 RepID=UPI000DF859AC|nr:DoxX family protein [Altererythrobacter sp. ZODW24]